MLSEHLEHLVNQRYLNCSELAASAIDIEATGSTITLSGNVASFRDKLLAQEIASEIDEVGAVVNRLEVNHRSENLPSRLVLEARRHIENAKGLPAKSVILSANDSVLTLTGYARSEREKKRIADLVTAVAANLTISNLLVVNHDQADQNISHAEMITEKLNEIIGLESEEILVSVANDTAQLVGEVVGTWKKESAEVEVRRFKINNVANDLIDEPTA